MAIEKYIDKETSECVDVLHWEGINEKELEEFLHLKINERHENWTSLEGKINHPIYCSTQLCILSDNAYLVNSMLEDLPHTLIYYSKQELLEFFELVPCNIENKKEFNIIFSKN